MCISGGLQESITFSYLTDLKFKSKLWGKTIDSCNPTYCDHVSVGIEAGQSVTKACLNPFGLC